MEAEIHSSVLMISSLLATKRQAPNIFKDFSNLAKFLVKILKWIYPHPVAALYLAYSNAYDLLSQHSSQQTQYQMQSGLWLAETVWLYIN